MRLIAWCSLLAVILLLASPGLLRSQIVSPITSYPDELYSGMNRITIAARYGLKSIELVSGGKFVLFRTGLETRDYRVVSGPTIFKCPANANFLLYVKTQGRDFTVRLRIRDCHDNIRYLDYSLAQLWNVSQESFGVMRIGEERCRTFSVFTRGGSFVIDSIISPSRDFAVRLNQGRTPIRISRAYEYDVCHTARRLGVARVPILVYLRRAQPAGGFTNFIVADTAVVGVVPAPVQPVRPPIAARRPAPPPRIVSPPVAVIVPPPVVIGVRPRTIPPAEVVPGEPPEILARGDTLPVELESELSDPTPYRVILLPNARSIGAGKGFVASYDVAGVLAGVGITDRLSVLAGALYVPTSIVSTVAGTAGLKYEWYTEGYLRSAVGSHVNYIRTASSVVRLALVYGNASLGDDDSRATLSVGYTWRSHSPVEGASYERRAAAVALGADHRFARHWKVAAEIVLLENSGYQPGGVALRYFTERLAIDVGLALAVPVSGQEDASLLPIPVVTAIWTW